MHLHVTIIASQGLETIRQHRGPPSNSWILSIQGATIIMNGLANAISHNGCPAIQSDRLEHGEEYGRTVKYKQIMHWPLRTDVSTAEDTFYFESVRTHHI